MNKKNMLLGIGMGLAVGGAALAMRPKKRNMKKTVAKALKAVGQVADTVSTGFGW